MPHRADTLDRLPIGVALFGNDRRVAYANAAYADLVGRPLETLVGTHGKDLDLLDDPADQAESLATLQRGGTFARRGLRVRRGDGSVVTVDIWVQTTPAGLLGVLAPSAAPQVELAWVQTLLHHLPDVALWRLDLKTGTLERHTDQGTERIDGLGALQAEVVEADRDRLRDAFQVAAARPDGSYGVSFRRRTAEGERHIHTAGTILRDEAGAPVRLLGIDLDMTERQALQAALDRSSQFIAQVVDTANAVIVGLDADGKVVLFNRAASELTGWPPDVVIGRSWFDTLAPVEQQPSLPQVFQATLQDSPDGTEHENPVLCADGTTRRVLWRNRRASGPNGEPMVISVGVDVTEQRAAELELKQLAYVDPLTRLANRALLMERLGRELARARRLGGTVALLLLDLDHFKDVNDAHGHPAGDALLAAVGQRLGQCTRVMDTVARLGGDEFAVLQVQTDDHGAGALADRLVAAFDEPFAVEGLRLRTATSVGVALGERETAAELFRRADLALYRAKDQGRGRWVFYDPEMTARARARAERLAALDEALERGGLRVVYLPTLSAETGAVRGLEALVRWRHGEQDVPARELVGLAEQTGRIGVMEQAVLGLALSDMQAWVSAGHAVREVAVNVSMKALRDPRYAPAALDALAAHAVTPSRLVIEINERILTDDPHVTGNLDALKAAGVRFALDDFGDGASPIAALTRLPVQRVKVVRRHGEGEAPDADALWLATVAFAARLGREVVAEGIETASDYWRVREAGCSLVQGYLFGQPLTAQAVGDLLASGRVELPLGPSPEHPPG